MFQDMPIPVRTVPGKLKEYVLWENSNPASTSGISGNVTLSDDINNYDYIAVDWNLNYTAAEANTIRGKVYYKVSDYKQFKNYTGSAKCGMCSQTYNTQNTKIFRQFTYTSGTQIWFDNAYIGTSAYATWLVPLHVYGCRLEPVDSGKRNIVFAKDLNCYTSAQKFHTKNAFFVAGYSTTSGTQAKYLQGLLEDGTLDIWYNYSNDYTVSYNPTTEELSIQLTKGLNQTEGGNLTLMYEDLG